MRVGVLASGHGSNLEALLESVHGREVRIVCVGSDREDARALVVAAEAGIPTQSFPKAAYPDRAARDLALADWLAEHGVDLVVTAGYMAILAPEFIARYPEAIVNVHPSLLPAFPGIRAIEQALEAGAAETGVTVHRVDEGVDTGPVLLQEALVIPDGIDADGLHDLLREIEHRLLPEAVRMLARAAIT